MTELRYTSAIVLLMLFTGLSYGQSDPFDFDDDVGDEPTAPINGFIAVGIVAGVMVGVTYLKPRLR
jgi:hypothetical protein